MLTIAPELQEFIEGHRERFQHRQNNLFAFALGQVARYYRMLSLVLARYIAAGNHWQKTLRQWNRIASERGRGPLSDDDAKLWEVLDDSVLAAQLEVETFYLLAKITLDRIAHFVEFYFGQAQRCSLDSHDGLTKCFERYCAAKKLESGEALLALMAALKRRISDFRDYHIAHGKSGRTMRGINMSADGHVVMPMAKLFGTPEDVVQSEDLIELSAAINEYILQLIKFLRLNEARCALFDCS